MSDPARIRDGRVKMFIRPKFPAILGCDLAGEVVRVGKAAKRLKVGDQVFAMMPHDYGAQAELVALPEDLVVQKPENLTMVEAGSIGATAITAVQAMRDIAKLGPGTAVLINGASGGAGIFAVQIRRAEPPAHIDVGIDPSQHALVRIRRVAAEVLSR